MHHGAKVAIKKRIKKWEEQSGQLKEHTQYLEGRLSYLEDLLRIYQQDIESVVQHQSAEDSYEDDLIRLTDANNELSAKLRAAMEELADSKKEKENAIANATNEFKRALSRNNARQANTLRVLQQENDVLKGKVANLEATINERKAMENTAKAVEVLDLKFRIEELEGALRESDNTMAREQALRATVEEEAVKLRQQLHNMVTFMEGLDDATNSIFQQIAQQSSHHRRLVDQLLQTASSDFSNDAKVESETVQGLTKQAAATCKTPTDRLAFALSKLKTIMDAQQVELSLSTRCALDSFEHQNKDTTAKLHSSFAQCELLVARLEEQERNFAEQRDQAFSERDKALNQRDQAITQFRTKSSDKKVTKHAEAQTVVRGEFSTVVRPM